MRTDDYLLGVCAGAAFCIAGLVLLAMVAGDSFGATERTDYLGSLDEVFANYSPRVQQPESAVTGVFELVERPYGSEVSDSGSSAWALAVLLLAPLMVLLI